MVQINLKKSELEYFWGFLMAQIYLNANTAAKDKRLMDTLSKIKKQVPYLKSIAELLNGK